MTKLKYFLATLLFLLPHSVCRATTTPYLGLQLPEYTDSGRVWQARINTNFSTLDSMLGGFSVPGRPVSIAGTIDAAGFTIGGVPVGTSTDTFWEAVDGGITYGLNVGTSAYFWGRTPEASERWKLRSKLGLDFPVPHFAPVEEDKQIAFDIGPKGTPTDWSASTGVAWIDLCSTDLETETPYQSLRMGIFSDGTPHISAAYGSGGTQRPLLLNIIGGNVGIGPSGVDPVRLLTLNGGTAPALAFTSADVEQFTVGLSTGAGQFFSEAVSGDGAIRGMGGMVYLGSYATTPHPTISIAPGSPGKVGIGTGDDALTYPLTVDSTGISAVVLRASGVDAFYVARAAAADQFFTGAAAGDLVLRGIGGKILLGSNDTTPVPAVTIEEGTPGKVGVNTGATALTSPFTIASLPAYADNAAALAGGLTAGALYRSTDAVYVVH